MLINVAVGDTVKGGSIRRLVFLLLLLFLLTSCYSVEVEPTNIEPMPTTKINKIEINNYRVNVTITVGTPNPCWDYYRTNSSELNNEYAAKIFAKPNGDNACPTVLWSFTHEEIIYFSSSGEKRIRFWQSDSTYIDTTIVL